MLTKNQKEKLVKEIKEYMNQNKILVMADFRGLTVKDMSDLKKEIREVGGKMQVVKKTLVNVALKEKGIDFDTRIFTGPLAFIFGPEETAVPKKIWSFFCKNDKLKIEGGLLENEVVTKSDIEVLAKLPTKEELLGRLVGTVQEPVSGFVRVLAGAIGSFTNVIRAISENKA
ncbi:MAG: 50S ribosomal protein L10 [Candidatus Moraniibacteriota bacterium]